MGSKFSFGADLLPSLARALILCRCQLFPPMWRCSSPAPVVSAALCLVSPTYLPPTQGVRARPRSCSFEAPALNHGRNARVANPTKRAPSDAPRADRASAAQPTVEVAATGRRRPRTICHTERTSVRQSVQASAECVRAMWSRWRPCVLAALAGRGARVRDSSRVSKSHAQP